MLSSALASRENNASATVPFGRKPTCWPEISSTTSPDKLGIKRQASFTKRHAIIPGFFSGAGDRMPAPARRPRVLVPDGRKYRLQTGARELQSDRCANQAAAGDGYIEFFMPSS